MPDLPVILLFSAIGFLVGALVAVLVNRSPVSKDEIRLMDQLKERTGRYQELQGLWKERATGRLVLSLGEKMVEDPKTLDPVQRQQLGQSTQHLLDWLGVETARANPLPGSKTLEPRPAVLVQAGTPEPTEKVEEPKKNDPLSIVDQMNEILKSQVAGTPLEGRGIRLVADPAKGVVVWMGLKQFEGVDAVTDPQVKAALHAAAIEWENRQERPHRL